MAGEPKKTVWILGAGFSKSLGAPLLTDMLSFSAEGETRARFDSLQTELSLLVHDLFRRFNRDGDFGAGRWSDAEQFLDYLDVAQTSGPRASVIETLLGAYASLKEETERNIALARVASTRPLISEIVTTARRVVAAECCGFLQDANLEDEMWQPYVRWANLLGSRDTVVTFNYDRVLERLSEGGADLRIATKMGDVSSARKQGAAPVLKLHGSVDWQRTGQDPGAFKLSDDPEFAVTCVPDEIALATPGPTKRHTAHFFGWLWSEALSAIRRADNVVFVGYRFPPSDSEARRRIWGAFRKREEPALVHVCLGHDVKNPWSLRAAALIEHSERAMVEVLPFLAEDYFTVFER